MNTYVEFNQSEGEDCEYDYGVLTIATGEKVNTEDFDDFTNDYMDVCSILFPGIQDIKITIENAELFDTELNEWTNYLEVKEPILSERCFVVRAPDKKQIDGKITGIYNNIEIEDYIDVLPELIPLEPNIEMGNLDPTL